MTARMTQAQRAEAAGVPQSAVSAFEKGRRVPSPDQLGRLVQASGWALDLGLLVRRRGRSCSSGSTSRLRTTRSSEGALADVSADELDTSFADNARATVLLVQALAARVGDAG